MTLNSNKNINVGKVSDKSIRDKLNKSIIIPYPFDIIFRKLFTSNATERSEDNEGIKRWNWGAFFLSWIWGLFNKSYLPLLSLIPCFGLIWVYVCGVKGNEWAWKNKEWRSIEHFHTIQKKWALYGAVFWGIFFTIFILCVMTGILGSFIK